MSASTMSVSRISVTTPGSVLPRRTIAATLTALLVSAGLLFGVAAPAHAAEVTDTIDGITYTADDSDVAAGATITDYDLEHGPVVDIPDQITLGGITFGVTTIGSTAFEGTLLTTVTIPDSVTTIGNFAFTSNALTTVTIPDSVTTLGHGAFGDNLLTTVTIPDAVTTIGSHAFADNALITVTIPDAVTTIGLNAFAGNALTTVRLGDSVTTIGTGAFGRNLTLTSVSFTGPAPTTITGADSWLSSLGTAAGLAVYYPAAYGEPATAGGYTTPTWQGYAAQPDTYTVIFDSTGGSNVPPVTGVFETPPGEPVDPTRTGYAFTGWYTDATATTAYDFNTPVTGDLTLYAGWSVNSYSARSIVQVAAL